MNKSFADSGFARMYVWFSKAKFTMGIFFVAYVIFYLFLGWISAGPSVSLDFFTAIQMIFACFFIGVLQKVVLSADTLTFTRGALWIGGSAVITIAFGLGFGWFASFPSWCAIVFFGCAFLATLAMILNTYFSLHQETKQLNERLRNYQGQANHE